MSPMILSRSRSGRFAFNFGLSVLQRFLGFEGIDARRRAPDASTHSTGRARYAGVALLPMLFVATTTLMAA